MKKLFLLITIVCSNYAMDHFTLRNELTRLNLNLDEASQKILKALGDIEFVTPPSDDEIRRVMQQENLALTPRSEEKWAKLNAEVIALCERMTKEAYERWEQQHPRCKAQLTISLAEENPDCAVVKIKLQDGTENTENSEE